jgi:hypothetical protein
MFIFSKRKNIQLQRIIKTVETPDLHIQVPASFVHRQVEILVITLDEAETKPGQKRRFPPPQFAKRIEDMGDVMTSIPIEDWGH